MRFFDNGRMLYSLDTIEPEDMAKHLAPATETPKMIFEGSYTLVGKNVHVEVSSLMFVLISQSFLSSFLCGHFTVLQLEINLRV